VEERESAVCYTIDKTSLNQNDLLVFINNNRKILNGKPLDEFKSSTLKSNLSPPELPAKLQINPISIERDISVIQKGMDSENLRILNEVDRNLRALIGIIKDDPTRLRALSLQQLTQIGLGLLDETGDCPLCDSSWEPNKIRKHLEDRLIKAKDTREAQEQIKGFSEQLRSSGNSTINSLSNLKTLAERMKVGINLIEFESWIKKLNKFCSSLIDPINDYPSSDLENDNLDSLFAPVNLAESCSTISSGIHAQIPSISPEQIAWDSLTRLSENLRTLEKAQEEFKSAELLAKRSTILLNSFQHARDSVLEKLYSRIQDRFVNLYRKIHNHDEETFNAVFEQTEAKLNIGVDFHGRGLHPPHALHSEGHQDTMGLCLYLTLAEHLTNKITDLIILDDVVMSVDAEHRRDICELFSSEFPDKQFFITTHDRTWASQLKAKGVVNSKQSYEFYNWKIQTGTQINNETDLWMKIEEDLKLNDVSSAASKLRRGIEEYFSLVCESIQGKVPYTSNFRWELSDLLSGALTQYKDLIKKGKDAANSWGDKPKLVDLAEKESIFKQTVQRSNIERWVINDNVHYNSWANYTVSDFRPILEAFQDLFDIFNCVNCESLLTLSIDNQKRQIVGVRCKCSEKWNLNGK
jgi:hypothetical protein